MMALSLEDQVAAANAEIISAAAESGAAWAADLQDQVFGLDGTVNKEALTSAFEAFGKVNAAFFDVEPAFFYADEKSSEEQSALPSALHNQVLENLGSLEGLLEKYAVQPLNPLILPPSIEDGPALAKAIHGEAAALHEGLQQLAGAWSPLDEGNFRNRFFSASSVEGIGRILRGLTAVSAQFSAADLSDPASIAARLRAVKTYWDGSYELEDGGFIQSPGLGLLMEQSDAKLFHQLDETLNTSLQLVEELGKSPDTPPEDLSPALQHLHFQLENASSSWGL